MNKFIHSLEEIGLSNKEARAYLALLSLGKASAYTVAAKAGMKRPTTYVVLTELMKKGMVLKTPGSKRQAFTAKSPDEFFKQQEEKLSQSKRILPELMSLSNPDRKIKVTYYEGYSGFIEALKLPMQKKVKEVIGFYAKAEKLTPELYNAYQIWRKEVNSHGITIRGVTPDHPSLKETNKGLKEEGHLLRYLPHNEYSSKTSVDMGDDFVRIMLNDDIQAVVIENKELAHTLKQIFEIVWKATKGAKESLY